MSWLRDRVESPATATLSLGTGGEPWVPHVLDGVSPDVLRALTYAVLDEREADGVLSFVLTPWPRLDALGRPRHDRDRAVDVPVAGRAWTDLMKRCRVPEVLRERPPRIGDAFALLLTRPSARGLLHPVGPVVDVTADARDAARAAFYGAVAAPLTEDVADVVAAPETGHAERVAEPPEWTAHVRGEGARS
ncbi:MAG TPA: hypothetical protein VFQ85_04930 [Mycobacteriales bacterium]|jgi:hypothetical protein|nr:hypothetical protein [Mycobacteriales bacterium]